MIGTSCVAGLTAHYLMFRMSAPERENAPESAPTKRIVTLTPSGNAEVIPEPGQAEADSSASPEEMASRRAHAAFARIERQLRPKSNPKVADTVKDVGVAMDLLKQYIGSGQRLPDKELSKDEKKQLWGKYGHLFSSKEDAQKAYDEYRVKIKNGEITPNQRQAKPKTGE